LLQGQCVFWGIAPVVGERSKAFWETTNRVIFPTGFSPTLDWNRAFAIKAITMIQELGDNVYFMPIRVNLSQYLTGLLST